MENGHISSSCKLPAKNQGVRRFARRKRKFPQSFQTKFISMQGRFFFVSKVSRTFFFLLKTDKKEKENKQLKARRRNKGVFWFLFLLAG